MIISTAQSENNSVFLLKISQFYDSVSCENSQNARVAVEMVSRNFATGKKAHKRDITQRMSHDLQLGARCAEVRSPAARTTHVDSAGNSPCQVGPRFRTG